LIRRLYSIKHSFEKIVTYKPKNILITGSSSGIGASLAVFYAAPGVFLALTGRHAERLSNIAMICRDKGAIVEEAVLDVTDCQKMKQWIEKLDHNHPLDLVIANAGISGGTGGCGTGEPEDQVRQIFDINLGGILNTVHAILPLMQARKKGQIALMASLASFSGWPGAPSYSASKGAVRLYGEALRSRLRTENIKVNVICPGFIQTPMTAVNDYAMPFMMEADQAADFIARGLEKNKGRIAFPWQTYFIAGFIGILPYWISSGLLKKLPEKPPSSSINS